MPEGWQRLGAILGDTRVDVNTVVTGALVAEINRFDRPRVRQQARDAVVDGATTR
jgi:hypothetical protein